MRTRCDRLCACIFSITRATWWISTVRGLIPSLQGDLLVGPTDHQCSKHVALAPGEPRQATIDLVGIAVEAGRQVASASRMLRTSVARERLLDEVDGAELHRHHRHGHVAMPGHHDHRRVSYPRRQLGQQLDPVHAGHMHVNHQAGVRARSIALEEVGGGRERLDRKPFRLEHGLWSELRTASSSSTTTTVGSATMIVG